VHPVKERPAVDVTLMPWIALPVPTIINTFESERVPEVAESVSAELKVPPLMSVVRVWTEGIRKPPPAVDPDNTKFVIVALAIAVPVPDPAPVARNSVPTLLFGAPIDVKAVLPTDVIW
jgi:hypothetical protein